MSSQSSPNKLLGQVLHKVIKEYVTYENENWYDNFNTHWEKYKSWKLAYMIGDDWDALSVIGLLLLRRFADSYEKLGITACLNENKLSYIDENSNIITKQPDFIGLKDGRVVIIDFKFGREWSQEDVDSNEQLTEYAMIVEQALDEKPPIHVAVCNLKKDSRQVRWIFSQRGKEQIEEFRYRQKVLACEDTVF